MGLLRVFLEKDCVMRHTHPMRIVLNTLSMHLTSFLKINGLSLLLAGLIYVPAQGQTQVKAQANSNVGRTFELGRRDKAQSHVQGQKLARPVRQQARGNAQPQTLEGLSVTEVMSGLGDITDLALSEKGDLYVTDARMGRVWALADRGQDGTLDGRRPVCGRFDNPTGLAAWGENIVFISDRHAIWRCDVVTAQVEKFVSLSQVPNDLESARPLAFAPEDGAILIGLTDLDQSSKLIRIDPGDRKAEVISQYDAPIGEIATQGQQSIWVTIGPVVMDYKGRRGQRLEGGYSDILRPTMRLSGLILPGQFVSPPDWPKALSDHILVAQSGASVLPKESSGGINIMAVPTEFGQPQAKAKVVIGGFTSSRRDAAWGKPGPMVMDARGLFFADAWQGTLWRVSVTPKQIDLPVLEFVDNSENVESEAPAKLSQSELIGSTIEGSKIPKGSQIEVGSYLVRDYELKRAAEKEAKKAEREAKRAAKETKKQTIQSGVPNSNK